MIKKYKNIILYIIFGVVTTVINMTIYGLCYELFHMSNIISTIWAWIGAVIVAYATNKVWVFDSRSFSFKVLIYELTTFFSCRILTGLIDIVIMYIAVNTLSLNAMIFKFVSNVIVVILNFIASKLVIFKKRESEQRYHE